MYTALYYPFTTIEDESILKCGLLLWDRLEFIAPGEGFSVWHSNPEAAEACELIVTPLVPNEEDKKLAHDAILGLWTSDLPSDFLFEETDVIDQFDIYPEKFLPATWEALRQTELAGPTEHGEFNAWAMSHALGLSMMSILAESCAGTEKRTITDLIDSYKLLNQSIAGLHSGNFGQVGDEVERLITISIKIIDPSKLSFRELIEFRKDEERSQSTNYRELRHNFLKKIDSFVTRFVKAGNHKGSRKEIEKEYEKERSDD